jgi:hypothetical protein
MFWIPKSLTSEFINAFSPFLNMHNLWDALTPLVGEKKIGYMVSGEAYDSDSAKEWNPYYFFVQRPEGPKERQ